MADSAAKRRKTSPTTSVPIDAPATPSRIPIPRKDAQSLARPSFASPTKASLARHNPQLLNRPSSSGSGSERPGSRGKNIPNVFAKDLGEIPLSIEGRSVITGDDRDGTKSMSTTQENEPATTEPTASQRLTPRARSTRPVGGGLSAKPRRLSRSPSKQPEKTPIEYPGGKDLLEDFNPFQKKGLRRSPVSGQGEILGAPTPAPVVQDDINPFKKTGLRRSPVSSQPVASIEQISGELGPKIPTTQPELSTTPVEPVPLRTNLLEVLKEAQEQEKVSEAPANAQESKNSPKEAPVQAPVSGAQHPEEPDLPPTPTQRGIPDPVVTTPPTGIHDTPSKRARRSKALSEKLKSSPLKPRDPPPQEPTKELAKKPEPEPQTEVVLEKPLPRRQSARFLIPEDPYASKKKERDDLLRELQQLQADIALANQENERLRLRSESKKKGTSATPNSDELVAMLLRSTAPEPASEPKRKPASIFKSIGSFLPFRPRRKPIPLPVLDKPLPSHLPIALDDPLPYIQAFSPLIYSSTITLLPSEPIASESSSQPEKQPQPSLQRHVISASHPSGLFSTRLAITVNTLTLSIATLDILRLDMNAEKELGTFIRARARSESPLGKDITVICWAMSRWIEVSIQRARFWCDVEHEFGTSEARAASLQRKRKRKRRGSLSVQDNEAANGKEVDEDDEKSKWSRRQLLPHIGRTGLELTNENIQLRLEWRLGFDWTGEVESTILAHARVPRSWQQADDRSSLAKVPETFDRLVKERGPLGAVRAIVGLLMPGS